MNGTKLIKKETIDKFAIDTKGRKSSVTSLVSIIEKRDTFGSLTVWS